MTNFTQWAWGTLLLPIITLFTVKADKSDLDRKADKAVVDEMSKTLDRMEKKLDDIIIKLLRR